MCARMCLRYVRECMPSTVHMWKSEGSKRKLILSFYPGSLGWHSGGLSGLLTDPCCLCKVEGACLSTSEVQWTLSAPSHYASLWYKAPQWLPTGMRVWPWVLHCPSLRPLLHLSAGCSCFTMTNCISLTTSPAHTWKPAPEHVPWPFPWSWTPVWIGLCIVYLKTVLRPKVS